MTRIPYRDTWTPERTYRRLPIPDYRHPVQVWGERIATGLACALIGFVLILAALR